MFVNNRRGDNSRKMAINKINCALITTAFFIFFVISAQLNVLYEYYRIFVSEETVYYYEV